MQRRLTFPIAAFWLLVAGPGALGQTAPAPTGELDALMQQVLTRRDDNWKKVQQYIFDEQERVEFRGPGEMLLWGAKREYIWYPREGFFVRSPVRFNGVTISERDREKYEQDFLRRHELGATLEGLAAVVLSILIGILAGRGGPFWAVLGGFAGLSLFWYGAVWRL